MNDAPLAAKIEVRDLVKCYDGTAAVRGVSFAVQPGTVFGLLGPNGAGKTTILECLLGLQQPDGGAILLDGVDSRTRPEGAKRRIGAVLHSTELQEQITPREAIRLFSAFYPGALAVGVLLERFQLMEKADAPFATLSAGQRQRLALALAFVHEPEILCLDEPTAGLDTRSRRDLHTLIRQWRDEGRTVLLTTHDTGEAHDLCDQVAVLREGRVAAHGPPGFLIARSRIHPQIIVRTDEPLDPAALLAMPEILEVDIVEEEARLEVQRVGPAVVGLVHLLEARGIELVGLDVTPPSLEDTLLELADGEPIARP